MSYDIKQLTPVERALLRHLRRHSKYIADHSRPLKDCLTTADITDALLLLLKVTA